MSRRSFMRAVDGIQEAKRRGVSDEDLRAANRRGYRSAAARERRARAEDPVTTPEQVAYLKRMIEELAQMKERQQTEYDARQHDMTGAQRASNLALIDDIGKRINKLQERLPESER